MNTGECRLHVWLAGVIAILALGAVPASGQKVGYWTNTVSGEYWTNAVNWTNCVGYPNGVGDVAYLAATQAAAYTLNLGADITVGQASIEDEGYTLTGNSLTLDNGGAGATVTMTTVGGRSSSTTFSSPIVVNDNLLMDWSAGNAGLALNGGISGASNRNLTILYKLSSGANTLSFGTSTGFLGRVDLYRVGAGVGNLGATFANATRIPGGLPGSVRSHVDSTLILSFAPTDANIAQFAFPERGVWLAFTGSGGALTNLSQPQNLLEGNTLALGDNNSTLNDRWPDAASLPLLTTEFRLNGRSTAVIGEAVGDLTFEGGCRIVINHNGGAGITTKFLPASITRSGFGTLLLCGEGLGVLGSPSNQVLVTGATLPSVANGMVAPFYVSTSGANSEQKVGEFATYDTDNGFKACAYDLTNDLAAATAASKITVTQTVSLAGQNVTCYALRQTASINNANVTIVSGGLSLGGAFWSGKDYYSTNCSYRFGADSNGEALIYQPKYNDSAKEFGLGASLAASNLTKFGLGETWLGGANTNLRGTVRVNQGGLRLAATNALASANDVELSYRCYLAIRTNVTMGGLRGLPTSYVTTNGTASVRLTLAPRAATTNTLAGGIQGSALSLTVDGPGREVLSGSNTYAGVTAVSNGQLIINGYLASPTVTCAAGTTLGGSGSLAGSVVMAAGTRLEPGDAGTAAPLTIAGDLSIGEGFTNAWEFAYSSMDRVGVGGTLTLPTNATVTVTGLGAELPPGLPVLFTAGTLAGAPSLTGWKVLMDSMIPYQAAIVGNSVVLQPAGGTVFRVQ